MGRKREHIAPSLKIDLDGNLISEKKEKDANELTLLQTIERVVELSKDSELDDEFLESAEPELTLLSSRLGVTPVQAVLFSICLDCGPYRVNYGDLACHLDMGNVRVLSYGKDLDALVRRRLLRYRNVEDGDTVGVPTNVLKALKNDEVPELPKIKGLDVFDFFEAVNRIFNDLIDDAATVDDVRQGLEELVAANPKLEFVKRLRALNLRGVNWMILFFFIHLCVNKDDNRIRYGELSQLFTRQSRFSEARSALRSGDHPLMVKKLIEHVCDSISRPAMSESPICAILPTSPPRRCSIPPKSGSRWWNCRRSSRRRNTAKSTSGCSSRDSARALRACSTAAPARARPRPSISWRAARVAPL